MAESTRRFGGLTDRERRELEVAARHIARAMAAMQRADVPMTDGTYDVARAHRLLCDASDALIDGLDP